MRNSGWIPCFRYLLHWGSHMKAALTCCLVCMFWEIRIRFTVGCRYNAVNIVRYYINNYRNWGRISIRCWIHKRHPIPRPDGRAKGVSFVNICEKIDRVITAPHCILTKQRIENAANNLLVTLLVLKPEYSEKLCQYHDCWWSGSFGHQLIIRSHDIDYVG